MRIIARAVRELRAELVGGKGRGELTAGLENADRMHGQTKLEELNEQGRM